MKSYYFKPNANYLFSLAQFIFSNFQSNIQDVTVVLPDGISVGELQNSILDISNGFCLLPQVIPISQLSSLCSVKTEHFIQNSESLDYLQQQIKMAHIITSYHKKPTTFTFALEISTQLIKIYQQIQISNISFEKIDEWVEQDLAAHWWVTADFLKFVFTNFSNYLDQNIVAKINIENLSQLFDNHVHSIIIVGSINHTKEVKNLIELLYNFSNCHLLLPPLLEEDYVLLQNNSYSEKNSLSYGPSLYINSIDRPMLIDYQGIVPDTIKQIYELNNSFEEANFIANKIINASTRKLKVGVVTYDTILVQLCETILDSHNANYNSIFGKKYNELIEIDLILRLAEFRQKGGDFYSFIYLCRSPLLLVNDAIKTLLSRILEYSKDHFNSYLDVMLFVKSVSLWEDPLVDFFSSIEDWIQVNDTKFLELFEHNIKTAAKITPLFLNNKASSSEKAKLYISKILKLTEFEQSLDENLYLSTLKNLFNNFYFTSYNRNSKIYFLTPEEALLHSFDLVILADFNQENWLKQHDSDPWLGEKIRRKLNLTNRQIIYSEAKYLTLANLKSNETIITRSRLRNGTETLILPFLSYVDKLIYNRPKTEIVLFDLKSEDTSSIKIKGSILPSTIFATQLELLLRNPYGFFARKILNLRKMRDSTEKPNSGDFGTLVHKLISKEILVEKSELTQVISLELEHLNVSLEIRSLWQAALVNILTAYLEYNDNVKKTPVQIFQEIEGVIHINLDNKQSIALKAIADRIEVYSATSRIRIIDFKTGGFPTKIAVLNGMSPQLILEAIILVNQGFRGINFAHNCVLELCYIKLNSNSPFIEETIIPITVKEILTHYEALKKLLNFYYSCDELIFMELPKFWQPDYDDYVHFCRK